jgi:hypothetical protein
VSRPRGLVLALGVAAASLVAGAVGLAALHGLGAMHAGQRAALRIDQKTAALDAEIALGRYAAAHHRAETVTAARLDGALPPQTDDRSILAAVVAAAASSGVTLADEQRAQAAGGSSGVVRDPVTLDVNAPSLAALVHFAGALEHQPRLFAVTALELTTAGGPGLHLRASVFVSPLVAVAPVATTSSP